MTDPNFRNGRSKGFGDRTKKQYPSMGQQARNLLNTAKNVARDPTLVTNAQFDERMGICKACPFYDAEQNRCTKCGCLLKGKARFRASDCPDNRWPILSESKKVPYQPPNQRRTHKEASPELYDKRMKICKGCAFFDHEKVKCKKCGCNLKGKAKFEGAKCPIQKW